MIFLVESLLDTFNGFPDDIERTFKKLDTKSCDKESRVNQVVSDIQNKYTGEVVLNNWNTVDYPEIAWFLKFETEIVKTVTDNICGDVYGVVEMALTRIGSAAADFHKDRQTKRNEKRDAKNVLKKKDEDIVAKKKLKEESKEQEKKRRKEIIKENR